MKKYLALAIIGITFIGLQIGVGGVGVVEVQAALSKPQLEKAVMQAAVLNEIIADKSSKNIEAVAAQRDAIVKTIFATDPQAALPLAEQSSLTGTLNVFYKEDFQHSERSTTLYKLRAGDRSYILHPSTPIEIRAGSVVRVTGAVVGDAVAAYTGNIQSVQAPAQLESVGEQKTLFLLLSYLDSLPPPKTPEEIYDLTFHGQFQKFYAEQSYGTVSFAGDVRGWYQLPRTDDCNNIDIESAEFAQLIARNNIDLGRYDRLVLVTNGPCSSYGGVSSNGKFNVVIDGQQHYLSAAWISIGADSFSKSWSRDVSGDNRYPFSWSVWDYILSHEMGHSLGVAHANGWDCGTTALYGDQCRHVEYGNNFDAMGIGLYSLHFNAFYKELLGWLSARDGLRITSSGRYTIKPLQDALVPTPSLLTKKFATIQIPGTNLTPFYVEYRRAGGFDAGLDRKDLRPNQEGLFVNRIIDSVLDFPRLLDLQPTSAVWDIDLLRATLNKSSGQTTGVFTDTQKGITVGPVLAVSPQAITFDVKIEPVACVRGAPLVASLTAPSFVSQGNTLEVSMSFKNSDSYVCDSSPFTLISSMSNTWKTTVDPAPDVVLRPSSSDEPGNTGFKRLQMRVPLDAAPGPQPITVSVLNKKSNMRTDRTVNVTIGEVPMVKSIDPASGTFDTEVTIRGSRFTPPVQLGVYGAGVYGWVTPTFADTSTIRFRIPETLTGFECGCAVPTSPGAYEIYVFTNTGYSAPVLFEVQSRSSQKTSDTLPESAQAVRAPASRVLSVPQVEAAVVDDINTESGTVETVVSGAESKKGEKKSAYDSGVLEKGMDVGAAVFSGFVSALQTFLFE